MYLNITKPSKREERGGGGIFVMRTKLITRPSSQEETGIVLGLVFPSTSNRPLVFKAHACTGGLSRDRFPANSLA